MIKTLKISAFLISSLLLVSVSYGKTNDPCDEIPGNWVGQVTANVGGNECTWTVSGVGAKYNDAVRLQLNSYNGHSPNPHVTCYDNHAMYSGTCNDTHINITEPLNLSGTVFGGIMDLKNSLVYFSLRKN